MIFATLSLYYDVSMNKSAPACIFFPLLGFYISFAGSASNKGWFDSSSART